MAVALTAKPAGPARRRWRLLPVVLMVGLVHVWVAGRIADAVIAAGHVAAMPARLQVAFVRELQPAPPPAPPPGAAPAAPPAAPQPPPAAAAGRVVARRVLPPAAPASAASTPPARAQAEAPPPVPAPAEVPSAPAPSSTELPAFEIDASMAREPGDEGPDAPPAATSPPPAPPTATASAPMADAAASTSGSASTSASASASTPASAAPPHAGAEDAADAPPAASASAAAGDPAATGDTLWPPSTRLSYTLTGHYRGPVEGSAQVEWLREGLRYQMHLDVTVGPGFAPLMSRRMSSQGTLGAAGLVPERYDELTQRAFADPRHATMRFEPAEILLANGRRVPRPAAVQDTASQFGQVTWTFTREPQRLVPGAQLVIPLALPRRVDPWVFDVLAPETLYTPFGPVEAFPLKPRRPERPGGELLAEMWIAPTLQYLPVRIRIQQDAETWIDLMVDSAPLQARR